MKFSEKNIEINSGNKNTNHRMRAHVRGNKEMMVSRYLVLGLNEINDIDKAKGQIGRYIGAVKEEMGVTISYRRREDRWTKKRRDCYIRKQSR